MSAEPIVGYVVKAYPRFSETFVVTEILAREAAGERLVIFALRPTSDSRFHPQLADVAAPVIHLPRHSSASSWWPVWRSAAADPATLAGLQASLPELMAAGHDDAGQAVTLARLAREHGVTHLHAHFATAATTVARLAGRIAGLPYSFTAHAKDIFHIDVDPADLAAKLRDAHHAITISEHNRNHLTQTYGPADTSRLHLVHNGLDLARFPYRPRPVSTGRPARLLSVGRLVEKKGFEHLIDAADHLLSAGVDLTVDIAGEGPLAKELADQIAARGRTERIRLIGGRTQREIADLLASHDLFVAPFVVGSDGNVDGLPTVLLEAMASGIPCVAADVTGVGEVIRDGETGWLVPSGDQPALVDAITDALAGDAGRLARTDKARALIEDCFDSTRQAARLAQLLTGEGPR